ncbi:MAG: cytochrome c oxidase assembly protein [Chloroflexi bacterium]|nr:MAG: cytochrome c oxidase assembly protein [Chloroflexota bacterium]
MNPVVSALLQSWDWRIEIIVPLLLFGTLFFTGWRRLHKSQLKPGKRQPAAVWRLAAYLSGIAVLAIALMSPIDILGSQLFYMHMIQHLLLVMVVPPLLLIANPFPFVMWGLPTAGRAKIAGFFTAKSGFRQSLRRLTPPGAAWLLFFAVFLGWHDPNAYNAALLNETLHDLEHLTFFATAMLFWWHVTGAGPRIHGRFPRPARIAYLLAAVPVNMLTGVAIAFATEPIYTYYASVPRWWGVSVMEDQMLGGILMWIPGSMMFLVAAIVLIAGWVQAEDNKEPLPETEWGTEETMLAPGWEK